MAAPVVSVVMPVYNGERFLAEAVESVLGQTYANFELVAVDDASTDASGRILDRYRDPRVRVLTNERNLGGAKSANRGITEARGVYVARLDQDDVSLPQRLEKQVEFLERHPEIALVGTWAEIIDEEGREIGHRRFATESNDLYRLLLKFCALVHSSVMFRRAPVLAAGGYGTGALGRYCRDYELWLRLSETVRLANLPEVLVKYRVHSGADVRGASAGVDPGYCRLPEARDPAPAIGWAGRRSAHTPGPFAGRARFDRLRLLAVCRPAGAPREFAARTAAQASRDGLQPTLPTDASCPGSRDSPGGPLVRAKARCAPEGRHSQIDLSVRRALRPRRVPALDALRYGRRRDTPRQRRYARNAPTRCAARASISTDSPSAPPMARTNRHGRFAIIPDRWTSS